jgi:hypothetical protein
MRTALIAVGLVAIAGVLLALATGSLEDRRNTLVVGGNVVSMTQETIVIRVSGPTGEGKLSGSTITTRVSASTTFQGVRRGEVIGPSVPVVATIDSHPNLDGSYHLLTLATQTR